MTPGLDRRAAILLEREQELTPVLVREAAELSCLLEVSAPKPGNVSPGRPFHDLRYEDFLASAVAIGEPMAGAGRLGVGTTIRLAIEATARVTSSNTNLGIVLLYAPLARAALDAGYDGGARLRDRLRRVLATTTVEDAREAYAAIRLVRPGGLGRADAQDVHGTPTETLTQVMGRAAERDTIAREYATAFDVTFGVAVPALERARRDRLAWDAAIVETFLTVLAEVPDTHIARRAGPDLAGEVSRRARTVVAAGGVRTDAGRQALDALDASLRDGRNSANPGTTADLTAAAIFVVLLHGGFHAATR